MSLMARAHNALGAHAEHPLDTSSAVNDWSRVQRLYAFCRARAIDKISEAHVVSPNRGAKLRRDLRTLEAMYGKARQHGGIVADCAIGYFRAQAMKDAQHPDFLGEWL